MVRVGALGQRTLTRKRHGTVSTLNLSDLNLRGICCPHTPIRQLKSPTWSLGQYPSPERRNKETWC